MSSGSGPAAPTAAGACASEVQSEVEGMTEVAPACEIEAVGVGVDACEGVGYGIGQDEGAGEPIIY